MKNKHFLRPYFRGGGGGEGQGGGGQGGGQGQGGGGEGGGNALKRGSFDWRSNPFYAEELPS